MQGKPEGATDDNVEAIAAFLSTLKPPPSIDAARGTLDPAAIERGRRIFVDMDCSRCHEPPTYTTPKTYDVHLRDEAGADHFNPPSLRGVGQRDAFLHDNRAATLRELFTRFKHPDGDAMKPEQLDDLLAFLRSL